MIPGIYGPQTNHRDGFLERIFAVATNHDPLDDSDDWHEHEHTAPAVQVQAEQLLNVAGSPEIAKHAIDVAARQHQLHEAQHEETS